MRGLRTATLIAVVLAAVAAAPAGAVTRAPLPRLARLGDPPATLAPGSAFTMRFRVFNGSHRLTSARATVTVRMSGAGKRIVLPGKAIVPALARRKTYRGSRRYVLPAAIAPGSYRLIACVKRSGVKAVCTTAARTVVVPGAVPSGAPQPPAGSAPPTSTDPPAPVPDDTPPTGGDPPADPPPPDTTAPAVTITSPTEAADLGGRKPLVSGTAGTAAGDASTVTVRFTGPGSPQTLSATVSGGNWSVGPADDLVPGTWSVVANQQDAAGNTGTSAARSFGINATLLAGGDIAACDRTDDSDTAALLDSLGGDAVAALGDLAYEQGTASEFTNCYGPTWGRAKARTRPAIGNHEYELSPSPYFAYFGAAAGDPAKGYYSYELGAWHVIVLNSNCAQVSCAGGSPQATWLSADLAAHPAKCTLAYWHHPLFNSSSLTGATPGVIPLWDILDAAGADLVLNGHAHDYERFAPQHSNGVAAANGMREIIAGTGGYDHHDQDLTVANSQARNKTDFGVLELTMRQGGYDWEFHSTTAPPAGFTDSGTTSCG